MMRVKTGTSLTNKTSIEQVLEYHDRTKHKLDKYAQGPEFLDWDLQPNPYRYFKGIERKSLPLDLSSINISYNGLYTKQKDNFKPFPLNIDSLGKLLGLSLSISAHKEYMGDRWALRCTPSSGNLQPTEAYIISQHLDGLNDGVHHYLSEDHSLQQRFVPDETIYKSTSPLLFIALCSISWRETWKYGERAFRYCQLDIGHTVATINYAAACLGWRVKILPQWSSHSIAKICGLNRKQDYEHAESENGDLMLAITQTKEANIADHSVNLLNWITSGRWYGEANILDKHPLYSWPVVDKIEKISEIEPLENKILPCDDLPTPRTNQSKELAKHIIYRRRSAQRFDKQTIISQSEFYTILDKCMFRKQELPWNVLPEFIPMVLVFYIHRVNSLTPGLYVLANTEDQINQLRTLFDDQFMWHRPSNCPQHLPFYLLSNVSTERFSKSVSCHQAIASDGVFSLSILLNFNKYIKKHSMYYRKLHWQAGLLGQLLYLEAESLGLQGTGIGCFFDDSIHSALGLSTKEYQVLYNFTVGGALNDTRISTAPGYEHLDINL